MIRAVRRAVFLIVVAAAAASAPRAEQVRVATVSPTLLQDGDSQGIAVTTRGRLLLAPNVSPLAKTATGASVAQVFASAADTAGNVFLGTGPEGTVLRVTPSGEMTSFFKSEEPIVTAVLALQGGDVLAATAPGGKIYRIHANGHGASWCETGERYVWALLASDDGSILAATGERGRLLKIESTGKASILFDSDESHLVSLARAPAGAVWAGGAGRGLVYRVDKVGHASVVYDDDLPEAKAIAVEPSGGILVAFDSAPASDRRPPAVRIRVAGGGAGGGAGGAEHVDELDSREGPALQGIIEGLPSSGEEEAARLRGKIVRIAPDGTATDLWRSSSESPFAVAVDGQGRALFATGEPAKIWRVEGPDEIALLATLDEGQATALISASRGLVVATSNPVATYALDKAPASSGVFRAPVVDAGGIARWGTLTWKVEGKGGRVELFTRTGNSEVPDGTWSAWVPALGEAKGSPIGNLDGRFLQWRARVSGPDAESLRLASVTATYATRNRAPSLRDLRVDPANGSVAQKATFRWSASDPDGDGVAVEIDARPVGSSEWKLATRSDPPPQKPTDPSLGNDTSSRDGKATWDTASWDEGAYEIRAIGSDQGSNAPGEGLTASADLPSLVRIDRTPPAITTRAMPGGGLEVTVTDDGSTVARLEVVEGDRVLYSARPKDGICDGPREVFVLTSAQIGAPGSRSLRATDSAGNAAEIAVPKP